MGYATYPNSGWQLKTHKKSCGSRVFVKALYVKENQLKQAQFFLFILFAASLTGCYNLKFATTPTGAKFSNLDEPGIDHALIYIYRPKSPPYLLAPVIEINGTPVSELPSDGYIKAIVPTGKLKVVANWDSSAWMSDPSVELVAQGGQRYFVGLGSNMRIPLGSGISNHLDIVSEKEAVPGLSRCGIVRIYRHLETNAEATNRQHQPTAKAPAEQAVTP